MAVPATSGSLKIKLSDMQIGDYIVCGYFVSASGSVGFFDYFGNNALTSPEIPYTGLAVPSGVNGAKFYFIKTGKGLLIADRVLQHTITWDTLNTGKFIQGLPWDAGNIIPTMTSNTAPSGVASASSFDNSGVDAWKAFNKTGYSDTWAPLSGTSTGWLQYEFANPTCIKQYTIMPYQNNQGYAPKAWTFLGSNDGVNFEVLDRKTNITGWVNAKKIFPFLNNKNYKMYRIDVTESGGVALYIAEIEMMETAGIFRCLTGGVAYADADGNRTFVQPNPSKGGWPTNNEWDKFIKNFPIDKIQAGKTLDDVFHYLTPYTYCQDTTVTGTFTPNISTGTNTASTVRILRGNDNGSSWRDLNVSQSSAVSANQGFRPVLEYYE